MSNTELEDRLMAAHAEASKLVARLQEVLGLGSGTDERKLDLIRQAVSDYTEAVRHHGFQ